MLDDLQILELPEPEWTIKPILPAKAFSVWYGEPEIGKSTATIALSIAAASDTPFIGYQVLKSQPVIYVPYEGAAHFGRRIGAAKVAAGVSVAHAVGLHTYRQPLNLLVPADVTNFIRHAQKEPDLGSSCWIPGLEQWRAATKTAQRIQGSLWPPSRGSSGRLTAECSSSITRTRLNLANVAALPCGAADVMVSVTKTDDQIRIENSKMKDAAHFDPIDVAIVPLRLGANACAPRLSNHISPTEELSDLQGKLLHALADSFGANGATTSEWMKVLPDVKERSFYKAKTRLLEKGYVTHVGERFRAVSSAHLPTTALSPAHAL